MGNIKKAAKILGVAFAAVAVIQADKVSSAPENSNGGLFDNALMFVTNQWNMFDLPKEDQTTKAMLNALIRSDASGKTDKLGEFSAKAFGVNLNDQNFTKSQNKENLYRVFKDNPLGVAGHEYSESAIRGFYYFLIYKNTDDFSQVSQVATNSKLTVDLARIATNTAQEKIKLEKETSESIHRAARCFSVAAALKAQGMDTSDMNGNRVTSGDLATHFYQEVYKIAGHETDAILNQYNVNDNYNDPHFMTRSIACAVLAYKVR